jgi:hypothetical protein
MDFCHEPLPTIKVMASKMISADSIHVATFQMFFTNSDPFKHKVVFSRCCTEKCKGCLYHGVMNFFKSPDPIRQVH